MSVTCPQCGLTQETPADRICRGCANAISSLVAPARSVLGLGKEAAAKALPAGARVAGVVLLLNAAANALTMAKQGPGSDPLAQHELKRMIVDLVVGGGLLAGKANLQKWAIDVHVLIIGESVAPTMRINQEKFEQAVIEEMKGRLTKLENLGRQALPVGHAAPEGGYSGSSEVTLSRSRSSTATRASSGSSRQARLPPGGGSPGSSLAIAT